MTSFLSANELGANFNPLAANSAPECKQVAENGVLAHLRTDASEDLDLHMGIFSEEIVRSHRRSEVQQAVSLGNPCMVLEQIRWERHVQVMGVHNVHST